MVKTDEVFELVELPENPVLAEGVLFGIFGVTGKYPSLNPTTELGGVLALEVFITASGL